MLVFCAEKAVDVFQEAKYLKNRIFILQRL